MANVHFLSVFAFIFCIYYKLKMIENFIPLNINYLVDTEKIGKDAFGKLFGLNRGAISSYIEGKSKPKIETLQKISEKYDITLDDLVNKELSKKENHLTTRYNPGNESEPNITELLSYLLDNNKKLMEIESFRKYIEMNSKKLNLKKAIKENDEDLEKLKEKFFNKYKKKDTN